MQSVTIIFNEAQKDEMHKAIGDCMNNRISVSELQSITFKMMDIQIEQINKAYQELIKKQFNADDIEDLILNKSDIMSIKKSFHEAFGLEDPTALVINSDPVMDMLINASHNVQSRKKA